MIPPRRTKAAECRHGVEDERERAARLARLRQVETMMVRVTALELRSGAGLPVEETASLLREALTLLESLPGAERLTRDVRAAPEFVRRGPDRARQALEVVGARLRYAQLLLRSPQA